MKYEARAFSSEPTRANATWAGWHTLARPQRRRLGAGAAWVIMATAAFIPTLSRLMAYAVRSDMYSYIPLIPVVSAYLIFVRRTSLKMQYQTSVGSALMLIAIASSLVSSSIFLRNSSSVNDYLAVLALAYICVIAAGGFLFLGSKWMASAAFPMAFLLFLVPLPDAVVHSLEIASVLGSADVSAFLFRVTGTPLVRDGTVFMLPGIVLQVARECSGIHSSWVLFITSLVASHLFLESPWRRIALVAFVIPLAIVRNAFRILTIGLLCVHVGPHMIDSIIHRSGGPFFFVLSLGPLFLLLMWLRRQER